MKNSESKSKQSRVLILITLGLVLLGYGAYQLLLSNQESDPATCFSEKKSDIHVRGEGTVIQLLQDDLEGDRHQRFILRLNSGQTILIAHNIDIAPRLDDLQLGDVVRFSGVYEYSDKGGTVHWTHHDPDGKSRDGWLELNGKRYQ